MTFRETKALVKAKRIRQAIGRMYDKDPAKAIAHVNERLDVANQIEANRAALLSPSL